MMNNVSSINAYSSWLDNSASNVANATQNAGKTLQSTVTSAQNGAPQLSTKVENKAPELQKEMTDQMVLSKASEANADAIRTQDAMTGTLLNILA